MSEFSGKYKKRVEQIGVDVTGLTEGRNGAGLFKNCSFEEQKNMPHDILILFARLFEQNLDIEESNIAILMKV